MSNASNTDTTLFDEITPDNDQNPNIEIDETETTEALTTLPEKSKIKYEKQYNFFMEWCEKKNVTKYTEPVLMQYFTEKANIFKSSTLWTMFSMLRATMIIKLNVNIGNYKKLSTFLKKNAVGYESHKTKIFTGDEINRFLTEAPDEVYLLMKVYNVLYSIFLIRLFTNLLLYIGYNYCGSSRLLLL